MRITLDYGKTGLPVSLPDTAEVLAPHYPPGLPDETGAALLALRRPEGALPLRDLVRNIQTVAIVTSDLTRPTPNHKILPWLLGEINHVPRQNIKIIIGTGSHRPHTKDELRGLLGPEIADTFAVIDHDALDKNSLQSRGISASGGPVLLNREYCQADFKIVTGFIEPHFFAGFSGGPKGIMPGLAGLETIMHFHRPAAISHPLSAWGVLEGNPTYEEAKEIALRVPPDFLVNVTLNPRREITGFFCGDMLPAHARGAQRVKAESMVSCRSRYDIVITTNSGYPLDQNLYQAVKGMCAAGGIVREGGAIICAAECSDGLPEHGNFRRLLQMRSTPHALLDMICTPGFSVADQWQAQKLAALLTGADIFLHSGLAEAEVRAAGLKPCPDIEECLKGLMEKYGPGCRVAVLPQGPQTIPYLA
jgi:nickel-dependent lactate racemase